MTVPSHPPEEAQNLCNPRHADPTVNAIDFAYRGALPERNAEPEDVFGQDSHHFQDSDDTPPPTLNDQSGETNAVAGDSMVMNDDVDPARVDEEHEELREVPDQDTSTGHQHCTHGNIPVDEDAIFETESDQTEENNATNGDLGLGRSPSHHDRQVSESTRLIDNLPTESQECNSGDGGDYQPTVIGSFTEVVDDPVQAVVNNLLNALKARYADELKSVQDEALAATTMLKYSRHVAMKAHSDLRGGEFRITELEQQAEKLKLELNAAESSGDKKVDSSATCNEERTSFDAEGLPGSTTLVLHETKDRLPTASCSNEDLPNDTIGITGDSKSDDSDSIQQQAEKLFEELARSKFETGQDLGIIDVIQAVIRRKDEQCNVLVKAIEDSAKNEHEDLKDMYELRLEHLHRETYEKNISLENSAHEERKINKCLKKELEKWSLKYGNAEKDWEASREQREERITCLENQLQEVCTTPNDYYDKRIRLITADAWSWQESAYQHRVNHDLTKSQLVASRAAYGLTLEKLRDEIKNNTENNARLDELLKAKDLNDNKMRNEIEDLARKNVTKAAQILSLLRENRDITESLDELYAMLQHPIRRSELTSKLRGDLQRAEASRKRERVGNFEDLQKKDEQLRILADWKTTSKELMELNNAKTKKLESEVIRLEALNTTYLAQMAGLRIQNEHLDSESALWSRKIAHYGYLSESLRVARNDPQAVYWCNEFYKLSSQFESNLLELQEKQHRINESEKIERECLERTLEAETRLRTMCWECDRNDVYRSQIDALQAENSAFRERFADELKQVPLDFEAELEEHAQLKLDRLRDGLERFTPLATDTDWLLRVYDAVGVNCTKPWNALMLSEEQRVIRGIIHCKQNGVEIPKDLREEADRFSIDISNIDHNHQLDPEEWYPLAEGLAKHLGEVNAQPWSTSVESAVPSPLEQPNETDFGPTGMPPVSSTQTTPLEARLVPRPLNLRHTPNQLGGVTLHEEQPPANVGVIGQGRPAPRVPPGFEHIFTPNKAVVPTNPGVGEIIQGRPSHQRRNMSPKNAESVPSKNALVPRNPNVGVIGEGRQARILPAVPAQVFPLPVNDENADPEPSTGAPVVDDAWEDVSLEGTSTGGHGAPATRIKPRRGRVGPAIAPVASFTEADFS